MRKYILKILMVGVLMFTPTTLLAADNSTQINLLGKNVPLGETEPYVEDSRTMVPIRLISENLGFEVKWDSKTKEFSIKGVDVKENEIVLIVGKMNQSQVGISKGMNFTKKNIDESPKVVVTMRDDRLYVPLRFFSESFGLEVLYDGPSRTVFISLPGETKPSADVVWNGNVKEFIDTVSKLPIEGMELSRSGSQVDLNKGQLLVTDGSKAPNGKGSKIEITAQDWIIPGRFYPDFVKKRAQQTIDTVQIVIEMYTSDKTAFSKVDNLVKNGGGGFNTSDGKKITVGWESAGLTIRFY